MGKDNIPGWLWYHSDYVEYLGTAGLLEQFTALVMMTFPEPRIDYYNSHDFDEIK